MTPEGQKIFRVTRKIPKDFNGEYIRDLQKTFRKVCSQVLVKQHRAEVTVNDTTMGRTYSFSVYFGDRQLAKEHLKAVIRELVDVTMWTLTVQILQDRIPSRLRALTDKYERHCLIRPLIHIQVKPKEHIKLC